MDWPKKDITNLHTQGRIQDSRGGGVSLLSPHPRKKKRRSPWKIPEQVYI